MPWSITASPMCSECPPRAAAASFTHGHPMSVRLSPIACRVAQQVTLAALRRRDDQDRLVSARRPVLPGRARQFSSPASRSRGSTCTHYPHKTLAAQLLGDGRARSTPPRSRSGLPGHLAPTRSSANRAWRASTTATCAARTVPSRCRSTRWASRSATSARLNPIAGHNLKLSLDANLQRVGQNGPGPVDRPELRRPGGAFVAMNPENGEVYAMGSMPTFDPDVFTGNLSQSTYNQLISAATGYPLLNRAIQSAGPTGSTFKPITATAALQSGQWSSRPDLRRHGSVLRRQRRAQQCRHNAGHAVDGPLDLVNALRVSSDDFFYNLGARTNARSRHSPQRRPAGAVGPQVRDRSRPGDRPARRAHRHASHPGVAGGPRPARGAVRQRHRPFAYTDGQHHVSAVKHKGWYRSPTPRGLRDRRRKPAVVDRRQR